MKKDIHPEYHDKAKISCACGESMEVGSTSDAIPMEICSQCHPFFTGKQKLIDTAQRVDRFTRMKEKSAAMKEARDKQQETKAKLASKKKESEKKDAKDDKKKDDKK